MERMKNIYIRAMVFWLVLLVLAITNAAIRETTYKPFLEPAIGGWAHQISSVTGVLLFTIAIRSFISYHRGAVSRLISVRIGLMWMAMTIIFESWMNLAIRHLSVWQVLETYYFWNGETWVFVLLSLFVIPVVITLQSGKPKSRSYGKGR